VQTHYITDGEWETKKSQYYANAIGHSYSGCMITSNRYSLSTLAVSADMIRAVRKSRNHDHSDYHDFEHAVISGHRGDLASQPGLSADYVQNQHSGAPLIPTWLSN